MPDVSQPNEQKPSGESKVSYSDILQEHYADFGPRETRKKFLQEIASNDLNDNDGPNGVVAHLSRDLLSSADIPVLGNILLNIGDVKTLNLILCSPGGDGTVVEKFVSLCRSQCEKFRVLIPYDAKSAATLISLGADEIVMGPQSEIGPIDAQIEVIISGAKRLISAQSFIDARDDLLKKYTEQKKNGEDTGATMQMIATLDLPFISECQRLMNFGRDVAGKFLAAYMFKNDKNKKAKIKKVVDKLTSVKWFQVHGRGIDGRTAKVELGLNIKMCGKNDPLWKKVWEYYTRAVVVCGKGGIIKMFETTEELLSASISE
jgi:hypothetical protein